jgi:hypothetical protein
MTIGKRLKRLWSLLIPEKVFHKTLRASSTGTQAARG